MARYDLTNTFIKLNETSGVIENISNAPVEISSQNVRRTGIILYPQQRYVFSGTVYVAKESNSSSPAAIAVETNIPLGSGGSSSDSYVDLSPSLSQTNQILQTIESDVADINNLAKETTHQRIAVAIEAVNSNLNDIKTSQSVPLASETTHERIAVALEDIHTSQSVPLATEETHERIAVALETLMQKKCSVIDYTAPLNAITQALQDIHTGILNHSCSGGANAQNADCLLGEDTDGIYMILDDSGNPTYISGDGCLLGQDANGVYLNI